MSETYRATDEVEVIGDIGLVNRLEERSEVKPIMGEVIKLAREALAGFNQNRKRYLELGGLALGAGFITGGVLARHHH